MGKQTESELIVTWKGRLDSAKKNQKIIFERAKENYEIYYAVTNETQRAIAKWKSNVFLPLLPGKARDAKAKLSILEPRFAVTPADSWQVDPSTNELNFDSKALIKSLKVTKKLNKEYANYTVTGELPPKVAVDYCETDAIVAGWGLALAPLATYKKIYSLHSPLTDANGNPSAYVDMNKTTVKELNRICTELIPLDIFRVYLSPLAKSWEQSRWIIIDRDESYADLVKANSTKGEKIYKLPAELKDASGITETNEYSSIRDVSLGYQNDGKDRTDTSINLFNVYDCYDQETGRFYTFVKAKIPGSDSDWVLIRDIENPYNHGLIPIVPFYVKRRPHSPWGESFFEISRDLQFAYNGAYNQFADNSALSGDSLTLVDKNSLTSKIDIKPGGQIEYDSLAGEKPEPWKLNDPDPTILTTKMAILEKNAEAGMTPQYTSGQVDSAMDKTAGTKGGIERLMEVANDKLSEMLRNMKYSLLRYGYIALQNAQQYQNYIEVLDTPDMGANGRRAIEAGDKVNADFLTPIDLQEAFDLDIDDESMLPLSKTERRAMFMEFVNAIVTLQTSSLKQVETLNSPEDLLRIDWADIVKEMGAQYGELNAPAFIKPSFTRQQLNEKKIDDAKTDQAATDEASKIAQQNNPGANVTQDPNGLTVQRQKRELSNFKDYPADVKNAVLESFGYPDSQLVESDAKAQLASHKSAELDVQVKQQMINAANKGQIDPATLAKFIKK